MDGFDLQGLFFAFFEGALVLQEVVEGRAGAGVRVFYPYLRLGYLPRAEAR